MSPGKLLGPRRYAARLPAHDLKTCHTSIYYPETNGKTEIGMYKKYCTTGSNKILQKAMLAVYSNRNAGCYIENNMGAHPRVKVVASLSSSLLVTSAPAAVVASTL